MSPLGAPPRSERGPAKDRPDGMPSRGSEHRSFPVVPGARLVTLRVDRRNLVRMGLAGLALGPMGACGFIAPKYRFSYRLRVNLQVQGRRLSIVSGAICDTWVEPRRGIVPTAGGLHVAVRSGAAGVQNLSPDEDLFVTLTGYWPVDRRGVRMIMGDPWDPTEVAMKRLGLLNRWDEDGHNAGLADLLKRQPPVALDLTAEELPVMLVVRGPRTVDTMVAVDPLDPGAALGAGAQIVSARLAFVAPPLDYAAVRRSVPWIAAHERGTLEPRFDPTRPNNLLKESFLVEPKG